MGEYINIINLKKIKEEDEERDEDFQSFLENYYAGKPTHFKEEMELKKIYLEHIRTPKKQKTIDNIGKEYKFTGNSILKPRPVNRMPSNKKITFTGKDQTLKYFKED